MRNNLVAHKPVSMPCIFLEICRLVFLTGSEPWSAVEKVGSMQAGFFETAIK